MNQNEMQTYYEKHISDLSIGKQIHVNHEDCSAGYDSKKRLYILNTGNVVLFKCHHCGESGYLRTERKTYRASDLVGHQVGKEDTTATKHKLRGKYAEAVDISDGPAAAKLWVYSYGFTDEDCKLYGIKADEYGIYLPVYDMGGALVTLQVRVLNGLPKYVTENYLSDQVIGLVRPNRPEYKLEHQTTILTEDIMSAYKIASAGYYAIPLLGTSVSSLLLERVNDVTSRVNVGIWLDNDLAGMKGSLACLRAIEGVGNKNVCVHDLSGYSIQQPKECSLEFLRTHIEETFKG